MTTPRLNKINGAVLRWVISRFRAQPDGERYLKLVTLIRSDATIGPLNPAEVSALGMPYAGLDAEVVRLREWMLTARLVQTTASAVWCAVLSQR